MVKKNSASKRYLKILGIISMILACLALIVGIVVIAIRGQLSLAELGIEEIFKQAQGGITEDLFKICFGVVVIISAIVELLIGWLLVRASKDAKKSTFLLVLLVLSTISGVYTLISAGFANFATAFGNIVSLTIDALALIAVLNVRREIYG